MGTSFDNLAKSLLRAAPETASKGNIDQELELYGFGRKDLFGKAQDLYDNTEDDSIKRQLLSLMVQIQGLASDKDIKTAPVITFQFHGDSGRLDKMLCPEGV